MQAAHTPVPAKVPLSPAHVLIPLAAIVALWPEVSSGEGLVLGIAIALIYGNPYLALMRKWTHTLLGLAVIGLGAGMDLAVIGKVGAAGIGYTVVGIATTLIIGLWLARRLKLPGYTGLLITVGTAICGGSAIAAVAPTVGAKPHEVTIALGTVFLLNALALFLFPLIGHHLHLSQVQFGLWSALAIHDTSSVVGATMQYGTEALAVGTTVKLARALWIVPVAFIISLVQARQGGAAGAARGPVKRPWFILGFIVMAALVTLVPELRPAGHVVEAVAKRGLVLTLFFIGSSLTRETVKSVGIRPLVQGTGLWVIVASGTLGAIVMGWIH